MSMKTSIQDNIALFETPASALKTLVVDSIILSTNPLQDPPRRALPILVPNEEGPHPVVFVLAGFTGNAPYYSNLKFNEPNAIQIIINQQKAGLAPSAIYVFIDAMTSWGGSQFLNSSAVGNYEDYIIQEVVPSIKNHFNCSPSRDEWCVMGGSSGGYGALHLGSKYPDIFGLIGAIAPDSLFSASLLPEFYTAAPVWEKYGSAERILQDLRSGKLLKLKNWHSVLNAIAMAACYCPKGQGIEIDFPLTLDGEVKAEIWKKIESCDPIHFLKQRLPRLMQTKVYLDVGQRDNFHLQYGSRQIAKILKSENIELTYCEFDGNHFDIGERRQEVWKWLTQIWRQ